MARKAEPTATPEPITATVLDCIEKLAMHFSSEKGTWGTCDPLKFITLINDFGRRYCLAEEAYRQQEATFVAVRSDPPGPICGEHGTTYHEIALRLMRRVLADVLFTVDFDGWKRFVRDAGSGWHDITISPDDYPTIRAMRVDMLIPLEALRSLATGVRSEGMRAAVGAVDDQHEQLVTLLQAAATVSRAKKTLERCKKDDQKFPTPIVDGGGGKPDEYAWSEMRPYLEEKFGRRLPKQFPAAQFVRS